MALRCRVWEKNHGAVSVDYGPLTFSLKIGEEWKRYGGTDEWPALEVHPTTAWNYGLLLDPAKPEGSIRVFKEDLEYERSPLPFSPKAVTVYLQAKARKIPEWVLDRHGLCAVLQDSPVQTAEPVETVTLIPMGCARLRISSFPVVSRGSKEWVAYRLQKPATVSEADVYWYDDTGRGQCRVPASWRLLYKDGKEWKAVKLTAGAKYGTAKDTFNKIAFEPVTAAEFRLEVQLQPKVSGGILEWRVGPRKKD